MDYDEITLDYIHSLEIQVFELEHQLEKRDIEVARLSRENTIFQEQLDQFLGPL